MAATTGTIHAVGVSGAGYHVDAYVPDAVGGLWTFDSGAGAGSTSTPYYQFPENIIITDIAMAGAPTATRGRITVNGAPTSIVFAVGQQLYSLNNRPLMNIKITKSKMFGIVNL
jgi:hypothetical protein